MSDKEVRNQAGKNTSSQEKMKNQNPNQTHNVKKEALGPNTNRWRKIGVKERYANIFVGHAKSSYQSSASRGKMHYLL